MGSLGSMGNKLTVYSVPLYEIRITERNSIPYSKLAKSSLIVVVVCISVIHTTTYIFCSQNSITYRGTEYEN